jgi:phage gpG-like protein
MKKRNNFGKNNPMYGKHHTEETKRKIGELNKGRSPSKETRKKLSEALKGRIISKDTRNKIRLSHKGEKNYNWKGDNVSYKGLHKWVGKELGKAIKCIWCSSVKKVEWANISGKYKRDLTDWFQLCHSCHMKYDKVSEKVWKTRKERYGKTGKKTVIKKI